MNESSPPVEVASSAQLGPVAEVRDGLLRLHIPCDDYSLPPRFLHGTHLLYEVNSKAALDVLAERKRQAVEGWTDEHDDEHVDGSMSIASACYALETHRNALTCARIVKFDQLWECTGWSSQWFKPKDRRRDLVRAAALLLAEIERLDRAGA